MEIVAEIGQNHNGDLNLAFELVHAAKECGADVAKFQLYDARALFPKRNNEWYEYNCKTELSREQFSLLAKECKMVGIEFLVSVFDVERVSWAEEVGVRRYKVASRSINDKELLQAVTRTGKPMIVSLGMWKGVQFPVIEGAKKVDFSGVLEKPGRLVVALRTPQKWSPVSLQEVQDRIDQLMGNIQSIQRQVEDGSE